MLEHLCPHGNRNMVTAMNIAKIFTGYVEAHFEVPAQAGVAPGATGT
jgi:hypothetical protein